MWIFAWVLLIILLGFTYVEVDLSVRFNKWRAPFYDAIQNYDEPAFWNLMLTFTYLAIAYILLAVLSTYFQQWLQNRWRKWLTEQYLGKWMSDNSYYYWHLTGKATDNPDQRLTDDIRDFVDRTLDLFFNFLGRLGNLVAFTIILWQISGSLNIGGTPYDIKIPLPLTGEINDMPPVIVGGFDIQGYMLWACLAYAIIGTFVGHLIGRALIGINYDQQRYEADMRFALIRLRETSEQVALNRGAASEEKRLLGRFAYVYQNFNVYMNRMKWLVLHQSIYNQLAIIFPFVVCAPRYFAHQITLGTLMRIASTFDNVRVSLSWFLNAYVQLALWRSIVIRLNGYLDVVEETKRIHSGALISSTAKGSPLTVVGSDISLPGGSKLFGPLNLEVKPGMSLLVAGPSGSGKSTLFRTLMGLWPFASGKITIPEGNRMMVIPQKPYMPLDTLRGAVSYPSESGDFSDELIQAAMTRACVPALIDKLNDTENWGNVLSPGEQQRLAFARVFLHKPDWLFLDEATSALDEETQKKMYDEIRELVPGITIVSIAHRASLRNYHDFIIDVTAPVPKLETLQPA
ncbi:MAG: ABC transporter ATP-binding protein/permease [Candidatus Methylacidiphilales bacterium]|nr:ABC transporter ATP-binding protein/permease [Candidatus Methylacidiphilales bacterium]